MLSKFDYFKPKSLDEAISYLKENQDTKILAGGTDLLVVLRRNAINCKHIMDIKGIPDTQRIEPLPSGGMFIGACVTVNQLTRHELIREKYTSLAQAADSLASYQLRNRATLAGNICNASPGSDLAAPLMVFEAKVDILSPKGRYQVDIDQFFTGVKRTVLKEDELVVGVILPEVKEGSSVYLKQSRLKGHDLATVGVAARRTMDGRIFLGMAAVAPTPVRLRELEEELSSKDDLSLEVADWAGRQVEKYISPISDVRSSKEYRLHIARVLTKRAIEQLSGKGEK